MTLDDMIQESISTWKPLEFTRDDLKEVKYRLLSGTSIEVENQINKLWERGYVPCGGVSMTSTTHWLVYSILMENLYYNYHSDESDTQTSDESSWEKNLRDSNREWWTPISWGDKEDDWLEPVLA